MQAMSQQCYRQVLAAGTIVEAQQLSSVAPLSLVSAQHNFCVVSLQITHIDCLFLYASGHRRYQLRLDAKVDYPLQQVAP